MAISEQELLRLRSRATTYFKLVFPWFSPQQVEDFGSYCVEMWLSGRSEFTAFKYLAIDFVRKGRSPGDFSNRRKVQGPKRVRDDDKELAKLQARKTKTQVLEEMPSFHNLKQIERAVLILRGKWGFTEEEIGELFGVTYTRISQLFGEAVRKVKSNEESE